jgi:hypothetical protein
MACPQIVVRGYGSWSAVKYLSTLGYGLVEVVTIPPVRYYTLIGPALTRFEIIGPNVERSVLVGSSLELHTLER